MSVCFNGGELLEASPSAGWRAVCVAMGVNPDVEADDIELDQLAAATDPSRSRREREKHALGVTS